MKGRKCARTHSGPLQLPNIESITNMSLIINLNSRIINEKPAHDLVAAYESHRLGWDLFTAREPLSRCQNFQQRAGWLSALNACAVASMPVTCADHLGF